GAERVKAKWSADEVAERPAVVVTVMSTVPTATAGVTMRIDVGETTVKLPAEAGTPTLPNETPVTSVKFVPVRMMASPPNVEPDVPVRAVTVGSAPAGVTVNWSAEEVADEMPAFRTVTSMRAAVSAGATALIR